MPGSLIDIGANLAHDSYEEDRAAVLQRASAVGVEKIVITGSCDLSNARAAELTQTAPGSLYSTAGVHPHHATDYSDASDRLIRELINKPNVVAVGECGLDFFRNISPRDVQLDAFSRQLTIAAESNMPIFLHQRDAHDDFVRVLSPHLATIERAVAHCFTGDIVALRDYLEMGLYIGITGWICDERRGKALYDIVSMIPDDKLMVETDAPYLLPRTLRPRPKSRRNEPMHLPEVVRVLAEARNQSEDHIAKVTTENALRFFAIESG